MYVNESLDAIVKKSMNGGIDERNRAVVYFIRDYYNQRMEKDRNPFTIPMITDMYGNPEEYSNLLDRMYEWGIKEFIISDSSTSLLEFLACILADSKYSANIFKSTYFMDKFNMKKYCLFVTIKRRRKGNGKSLPDDIFK